MSGFECYQIFQPLESGPEVSVYACRERVTGGADWVLAPPLVKNRDRRRFALELVRLLSWLSHNGFFLGVITPHQLYFRSDGHWIANFLGPYSLFKTDFRSKDFSSCAAPEYFESRQRLTRRTTRRFLPSCHTTATR